MSAHARRDRHKRRHGWREVTSSRRDPALGRITMYRQREGTLLAASSTPQERPRFYEASDVTLLVGGQRVNLGFATLAEVEIGPRPSALPPPKYVEVTITARPPAGGPRPIPVRSSLAWRDFSNRATPELASVCTWVEALARRMELRLHAGPIKGINVEVQDVSSSRVEVQFTVNERSDPARELGLTFVGDRFSNAGLSARTLSKEILTACRQALEHELEEGMMVDGQREHDPHGPVRGGCGRPECTECTARYGKYPGSARSRATSFAELEALERPPAPAPPKSEGESILDDIASRKGAIVLTGTVMGAAIESGELVALGPGGSLVALPAGYARPLGLPIPSTLPAYVASSVGFRHKTLPGLELDGVAEPIPVCYCQACDALRAQRLALALAG